MTRTIDARDRARRPLPAQRAGRVEPWALVPIVLLVAYLGLKGWLLWGVRHLHTDRVEDRAYERSRVFDDDQEAAARFAALGLRFEAVASDERFVLHLNGAADQVQLLREVTVDCYRPDDRSADRRLTWADPTHSLSLPPELAGQWTLTLHAQVAGEAVLARTLAYR